MKSLFQQFARPEQNLLGWLAGRLMAWKNRARSEIFVTRLAPQPGERLLEVGFGPGVDLSRLRDAVGERGSVAGLDASTEMVRQAGRRFAQGQVDIRTGSAEALPWADASFDAALSINSIAFWPDPGAGLMELCRVLRPGGRIVVAMQPMWRGASEADSRGWSEQLALMAGSAGFADLQTGIGEPLEPNPTAFLAARKPG